ARRVRAPWAALEPPAWSRSSYRGDGPGEPPSQKMESRTGPGGSPTDASPTKSAPPVPNAPRFDAAHPTVVAPVAEQPRSRSAAPIEDSDTLSLAFSPPASSASGRRDRAPSLGQSDDDDFGLQGRRSLLETVPRVAKQAEPEVARVLLMAASAYRTMQERTVADAARAVRIRDDGLLAGVATPGEARRL